MTDTPQDRLSAASNSPLLPHLYANSFNAGAGPVDVTISLERNDTPVATLNVSYACAKSLAHTLLAYVDGYEKATETRVVSHGEFQQAVTAQQRATN